VFIHPSERYFYCGHVNRATFGVKKKEIKNEKIKNISTAPVNRDKQPKNPNHWVKLWVSQYFRCFAQQSLQ
jgi:hypothetical protein